MNQRDGAAQGAQDDKPKTRSWRVPRAIAAWLALMLLGACGASSTPPAAATPSEPVDTRVELAPPGSRLRVLVPSATRIPHTLRYRVGELEVRFADAQVEPGTERTVAEAYLRRLAASSTDEIDHRPFSLGGHQGLQITMRGESRRRWLILWDEGAISRLAVIGPLQSATDAERVVDSVRFDPTANLDPRSALDIDADPVPDLPLLRVSTEQLIFREGGHAVPFPSAEAALDVTYVAYGPEGPPAERERGLLLGRRFQGLPIEPPHVESLEGAHFEGFALRTTVALEGRELTLIGAYLDLNEGALLVRASVESERVEAWAPRFAALIRSLRVP